MFTNPNRHLLVVRPRRAGPGLLRYTRAVHTGPTPTGQIAEPPTGFPQESGVSPGAEINVRIREPTGASGFDSFLCRPGKKDAHEKGAAWKEKSARFRRLTPAPRAASLAELNQDARRHR